MKSCSGCSYFHWIKVKVRGGSLMIPVCEYWDECVDIFGTPCEHYTRKGGKQENGMVKEIKD